jgi:hypothetical protein
MTFGTYKDGGDVAQANAGQQGNVSYQDVKGAAATGPAAVHSVGGFADMVQYGKQDTDQDMYQTNVGAGGHGGSDNTQANTYIGTYPY